MDLLDWHRGRLTARRLAVLIKHMPRDSALLTETDGEAADWSTTDYLLAAVVDHLAAANWMFASVHSDEDAEPPERPVPVPRPGDGTTGTTEAPRPAEPAPARDPEPPSPTELARFFS
ncbi:MULTISPECIES: hypothetical protein [Streptomyces]|uniref:DUF664 domain-containing protein n=1 Tax=Streptomyces sudanensis TaxID=436397 RepID=A0ABY4TAM5_9ACTN|nr:MULTISPECIES: hypothetical protein [Streptomyces]MCP9957757.1 hypothetical protein [Streptomyces sudanensis]MCP9986876.1 hypothetical protein [Streptomyces sudanensis]MCQ0001701.1 hypothetical protein [Streptomyces sudanensis]URN15446.1 hypothetical protein MW084_05210 [Streptomyces sudanensis]